jgi:hypothetical protein
MANAMEKLQTLNSLMRTTMALILFAAVGTLGWVSYQTYYAADRELELAQRELEAKDAALADSRKLLAARDVVIAEHQQTIAGQIAEIETLNEDIRLKQLEIERLDTALRLHKMERRLARISVLDVGEDAETGKVISTISFVELNEAGDPIGEARRFELEGQMIYVDYLVVKFEDKYVEQADLERGTSICLLNRIFGEFQKPKDGFSLDEPGQRPGPYERGGVMSDFETKIWRDFWTIANDPKRAAELGIRALHGDAVSIRVQNGMTYRITIRSAGGPEIRVEPPADKS